MTFFGRTPQQALNLPPPATVQSIAVLGAGSWGTAFARSRRILPVSVEMTLD